MTQRNLVTAIRLLAVIIATYAVAPSSAQKVNVPIQQDVVALAQPKVMEVLPLMDTDRNGKIPKKDFMNLMEAVFDRLDKDKKGEVDPRQFRQSVSVRGATGR
jgi:sulfatase maturation enzyme AslB (radical SAM superfamily)